MNEIRECKLSFCLNIHGTSTEKNSKLARGKYRRIFEEVSPIRLVFAYTLPFRSKIESIFAYLCPLEKKLYFSQENLVS